MSLVPFKQDACIVAVVELSASRTGLVTAAVPGIERQPLKKLEPRMKRPCLRLLHAAESATNSAGKGHEINRIAVAYEAGRDPDSGWRGGCYGTESTSRVIHPTSIAVSREHRRAKT